MNEFAPEMDSQPSPELADATESVSASEGLGMDEQTDAPLGIADDVPPADRSELAPLDDVEEPASGDELESAADDAEHALAVEDTELIAEYGVGGIEADAREPSAEQALAVDDTIESPSTPQQLREGEEVSLRGTSEAASEVDTPKEAPDDIDFGIDDPVQDTSVVDDVTPLAQADTPDDALDLRNTPDNDALVERLDENGLTLASVADIDYADNPILDWKESGSKENLQWVVERWDDTIAPAVATGATRDDLAEYDRNTNAPPDRQLANAFDTMVGDDAIRVNARDDGSLDPIGGRHRAEMAKRAGVEYLPVRIHR